MYRVAPENREEMIFLGQTAGLLASHRHHINTTKKGEEWWLMPEIQIFRRQRLGGLWFETSLGKKRPHLNHAPSLGIMIAQICKKHK
jgi:hypothetical protein